MYMYKKLWIKYMTLYHKIINIFLSNYSFGMAHSFVDSIGDVDVISDAEVNCVAPENIHTPPMEGIGNSWGVGGSQRPKNLKKCMRLNWNFQRGGGSYKKSLPWGRYGYFVELYIIQSL